MSVYPLAIVGSTGTGKTALSLYIAEELARLGYPSAIINMDSRQVYAEIPIISAQPTSEERTHSPHYLYGYLSISSPVNTSIHISEVRTLLQKLSKEGIIPLLVGGTGLYFHTLFYGISNIPPIQEEIRLEQRNKVATNIEKAYHELSQHDPLFAQQITPRDSYRIARGLEVFYSTGQALSKWHEHKGDTTTQHLTLGIQHDKEALFTNLRARIHNMIARGAEEEVYTLLQQYDISSLTQAYSCIGFRELAKYIQNQCSKETCIEEWFIHTRQYAKRQRTWFTNKHQVHHWIHSSDASLLKPILYKYIEKLEI